MMKLQLYTFIILELRYCAFQRSGETEAVCLVFERSPVV